MHDLVANTSDLLTPDDPAPFRVYNVNGQAPILVMCDHASNAVPARLHGLGLLERDLHRHIAFDIGAAQMSERLADRFDAPAVLAGYSRLVIDCNRQLDHPSSISTISDETIIPANAQLDPDDIQQRQEACFWPYHRQIEAYLQNFDQRGVVPAIISMHAFTPYLAGQNRPWHIGILWDEDDRIARPLIETLKQRGDFEIGENEPYSGKARFGYTIEEHAEAAGRPGVLIEVREDLISSSEDAFAMGDLLADALAPILANSSLYARRAQ